MEQNSEETTAPVQAQTDDDQARLGEAEAPEAPVRRRASRRVTAPAGEVVQAEPPTQAPAEPVAEAPASEPAEEAPAEEAPAETPKKRQSRARKKVEEAPAEASADAAAPAADAAASDSAASDSDAADSAEAAESESAAPKRRATRSRSKKAAEEDAPAEGAADAGAEAAAPAAQADAGTETPAESGAENGSAQGEQAAAERPSRGRGSRRAKAEPKAEAAGDEPGEDAEKAERPERPARGAQNGAQQAKNGESQSRSSRTRQRERKRRQGDDLEPEIAEDDVLLPIAGILDVLDNYAFVRTSGYLPGTNDVYVSLGQVKKYGLRKGDAVVGAIRQPRDGDGGGRQKYNAIVKVDTVNSRPAEENQTRPEFAVLTPLSPEQRLRLETEPQRLATRLVDVFAPIGKGQRGVVVGAPRTGKSTLLLEAADAIAKNHPDAHLMLVTVDERPEEVTRLQRTVAGEVIASTFDRSAEDHATVAELAVERAKRLVELGHDVVVLIDSLTALVGAYNLLGPAASRQPAGLVDPAALVPVKRILGAARSIENGGSLTILAAAQSGSASDDAILAELLGTANLELRLSRELADQRLFPAVDIAASGTRHDELLVGDAEAQVVGRLRRALAGRDAAEALEFVLQQLRDTGSNVEFLALAQRTQGRA